MVYAVVSVRVNTTDCDSVNMGSIPILLPKSNPSKSVNLLAIVQWTEQ
jgi:hypothetical protein